MKKQSNGWKDFVKRYGNAAEVACQSRDGIAFEVVSEKFLRWIIESKALG